MEKSQFVEKLVHINRITKVVKGGRRFGFSALVVVGNQTGKIGFAHAKSKQVPDAISYNLQVSSQQSFDNIIVNIEESTTVYIDTENLDWNETYYCRVRPIYNSSDFGEWSEISNFNIVGKKFPERNADIYNQELIQEGLVAFGGFAGASTDLASAVIDQYGNEIWNDGNLHMGILYNRR